MRNTTIQRLAHDSPIIALFGAACLLCCALAVLAAAPLLREYRERRELIRHYDTYISSSDGFDAIRLRLESTNSRLESKLSGVSAETPSSALSDILQELIRKGNECGIVLEKIQPQPDARSAGSSQIPVFLETKTDYLKLGKYAASLEASPRIIQIRKIAVEATKQGDLNVRLLVNCLTAAEGGGE